MNVEEKRIRKTMINTTLPKLNNLSAAQNCLVLLRSLHTSDLTFMYMLLAPESVKDICREVRGLIAMEEQGEECTLTPQEKDEALGYIKNMRDYYE